MVKVKELIEILKEMDGGMEIIISSDNEGNSCSKVDDIVSGKIGSKKALVMFPQHKTVEVEY